MKNSSGQLNSKSQREFFFLLLIVVFTATFAEPLNKQKRLQQSVASDLREFGIVSLRVIVLALLVGETREERR